MNNLLERLHASFFFYVLTGPGTFLKIGEYLPSVVIVSVAMMFGGLRIWVDAGWVKHQQPIDKSAATVPKWNTRRRNVILPLVVMLATHVVGGIVFFVVTKSWFGVRTTVSRSITNGCKVLISEY